MPVTFETMPNGQTARVVACEQGEDPDDLFTQAGYKTEDQISLRKKDLRTFLTGMNKQFRQTGQLPQWIFNPAVAEQLDGEITSADQVCRSGPTTQALEWFRHQAVPELLTDLKSKRKQRIDGEDWSCGFLGSRWSDRTLGGVPCRVCFYSKKFNEKQMGPDMIKTHDYLVMIDPHTLDQWQ